MNEKRINEMVNTLIDISKFSGLKRFPNAFYNLDENEQKEVVKRFRRWTGLDRPTDYETK